MRLSPAVEAIVAARRRVPEERAALVALSGIDGAGKGVIAARLAAALERRAIRVAVTNVDGWLNLPDRRFGAENEPEHFYRNAIRFEEMFDTLILPLQKRRSIRVEADFTDETSASYRRHLYAFDDVHVILLEGIYLLQPRFRSSYDLAIWIECTFETALRRAVARSQEGLSPEDTAKAYRSIYFPAQEIHFERDHPTRLADLVVTNDEHPETPDLPPASNWRWPKTRAKES